MISDRWLRFAATGAAAVAASCLAYAVYAAATVPLPPVGQPVLNNYQQARTISTGTPFPVTKAIYNGDGSACDMSILLNLDTTAVVFDNVPAGDVLQVMAREVVSPTACSDLVALY